MRVVNGRFNMVAGIYVKKYEQKFSFALLFQFLETYTQGLKILQTEKLLFLHVLLKGL